MKFTVDPPPILSGKEAAQLIQLREYLYQFHEGLNTALTSLDSSNFTPETAEALEAAQKNASGKTMSEQSNTLKSLIVKTAKTVQVEMDRLETELKSSYLALSDFGAFQQQLSQQITATAEGVVQNFASSETITTLQKGMVDFEKFETTTNQYIKTGLLYYEDVNGVQVPRYGVAVGEISTEITADGQEVLSRGGLVSTFTSDKLSFWNMGVEVAFFKSAKLYVGNVEIEDTLTIGKYTLSRLSDGSFGIMYGG